MSGNFLAQLSITVESLHHGRQFGMFLGQPPKAILIGGHLRIGKQPLDFAQTIDDLFQLVKDGIH